MTRHPSTEGNDLKPRRVDAQEDVTVPSQTGRISVANIEEQITMRTLRASEGYAPEWSG